MSGSDPDADGFDLLKAMKKDQRDNQVPADMKLERDIVSYLVARASTHQFVSQATARIPKKDELTFINFRELYPNFPTFLHSIRVQSLEESQLTAAFYGKENSFFVAKFVDAKAVLGLNSKDKLAVVFRGSRKKDFAFMVLHNYNQSPKGLDLPHGFIYWPKAALVLEPMANFYSRIGTGWIA